MEISERGYFDSEVLVSTSWLAENLDTQGLRIVESNEDPLLYKTGHIPGAVEIDWARDLNDPITRDYLDGESFSKLMGKLGIHRTDTVVLYGDKSNWWACYTLWVLSLIHI